jgi:hypothetical protein
MKERPILFNGPMVRAVLEGRKIQTRRVVKFPKWLSIDGEQPTDIPFRGDGFQDTRPIMFFDVRNNCKCPFGSVGDRLWVRETWKPWAYNDPHIQYKAGGVACQGDSRCYGVLSRLSTERVEPWRPSIHMPRWASRITLEITGVRVERLNDISEADAKAEGVESYHTTHAKSCIQRSITGRAEDAIVSPGPYRFPFIRLWESINGLGSWAENPWVWVITFQNVEQ